jgi:hypothetical protein
VFFLAIPFAIWIAIAHFHLYDVDRVLGGAISYTLLVVFLALGAETILEPIARLVAESAGFSSTIGQLIFVTYATPSEAMTELMGALSEKEELDLGEIATAASVKTATTLGVRSCMLVLLEKGSWRIFYSQGVDTNINDVSLVQLGSSLQSRYTPLQPVATSIWHDLLEVKIVLPLHHNGEFIGFLSFGPKTSSDIFTSSEQSMVVAMTALLPLRAASTTTLSPV